jgi:hypothetical protein
MNKDQSPKSPRGGIGQRSTITNRSLLGQRASSGPAKRIIPIDKPAPAQGPVQALALAQGQAQTLDPKDINIQMGLTADATALLNETTSEFPSALDSRYQTIAQSLSDSASVGSEEKPVPASVLAPAPAPPLASAQPPLTQADINALNGLASPPPKVIYGSYYQDFKMFRQFKDEIEKVFVDVQSNKSAALDIIASYLRGQKIIYIEAKTHCEQSLYLLMFPTIFISSLLTVLSLALEQITFGHLIVSGFGALNTFILGLVSYLKLDAKTEAHKTTAYQFDKLQTQCEFYSGKTLFFNDTDTIGVVEDVESKVTEIKDNNQFIVPESVRCRFPVLYSTNIFTEVKKIGIKENLVKHRLCIVYAALDKLRFLGRGDDDADSVVLMEDMGSCTIENLEQRKNDYMAEYLDIQKEYLDLNSEINKEIGAQLRRSQRSCGLCRWLKT